MRLKRIRRPWPWLVGAAIVTAPMLAGCGNSNQTTGPADNIPKESPVLDTKDSMKAFMEGRKSQSKGRR